MTISIAGGLSGLRAYALALVFTLPSLTRGASVPELPLHLDRASNLDLAVTGRLAGTEPGVTRYVRWADVARLPQAKLQLSGEFGPGEQEVTVVFLSDLWAALPVLEGADTLLATCTDGYAGVYPTTFIRDYRPFLILEINGQGPGNWPPPGLRFNPGPYVISVAASIVPAVADLVDAGHKRPWGVTTLDFAPAERAFGALYRGPWSAAAELVSQGREIWIHSCTSCHRGPEDTFGGTKGDRPFAALAALARYAPDYFRRYVTNPKGMVPTAKMEAHPHYTTAQLDALVAFVSLGAPP
jgi:cytochrome c2